MIKFNRLPFRSTLVAVTLSLSWLTGCTTGIEEAINGVAAQVDELTTVVENQDPPVVNVDDGDVTVNPPNVTVVIPPAPPTSQPTPPTASQLPTLAGATSFIDEDTSGLRWSLLGGIWNGSFQPGIVNLLPADWRNVVRTTHLLVVYDLNGNPIAVPPIVVEGGVDGFYTINPATLDTTQGCLQTTIRVRNSISNEEVDITLPEACR